LLDISEEEIKNAETARQLAVNYLGIWPIQSGLIRGALGSRMEELPAQAVSAMDELDELAISDPNDYTDYELGMSLGLRVRLLGAVVQQALEVYCPGIIDVIPILL